jgi:hypothetical protein
VSWWYKNGVNSERYLAIEYTDPQSGVKRLFYPDYIAQFRDGSVGIYDPKSGVTVTDPATAAKSDALQAYMTPRKGRAMMGGIVQHTAAGWQMITKPTYSTDLQDWYGLTL